GRFGRAGALRHDQGGRPLGGTGRRPAACEVRRAQWSVAATPMTPGPPPVITCSQPTATRARPQHSRPPLSPLPASDRPAVATRVVVPDDLEAIRAAVRSAVDGGAKVVITTGGTGLAPTDVTPEAVRALLDREVPGVAEVLRLAARDRVPTSVLSRGVAGTVGAAFVVTLPGSPGGVRDGMTVLAPLLGHVVDQLAGGDHRPGGGV